MLKHGILGLLNYGSMTGYEINRVFRDSLCYFWNARTSQIYRELQTLKKNGWATDVMVEQDGRPDKKLFTITDLGREELMRWLSDDGAEFVIRNPLMMKTFFRGECSLEENIAFFSRLSDTGEDFLTGLLTEPPKVKDYTKMVSDPLKALYWRMTVEYGVMFAKMHLEWVGKCKKELEAIRDEYTVDQRQPEGEAQ